MSRMNLGTLLLFPAFKFVSFFCWHQTKTLFVFMEQHEIRAAQTFFTGNNVLLASIWLAEPPLYWNYSYFMKFYFAFHWGLKSLILELNFYMIGLQSQTKSKICYTMEKKWERLCTINIQLFSLEMWIWWEEKTFCDLL